MGDSCGAELTVSDNRSHKGRKYAAHGEVTAVRGVRDGHHVLGIKHLLSKLKGDGTVLLPWAVKGAKPVMKK